MRKLFLIACFALVPAGTVVGSPSLAGTDKMPIFNTGVDSSGVALAASGASDPHWTIGLSQALTATDPNSNWVANNTSGSSQSAWIGSSSSPPATYTFVQAFLLPANSTQLSLDGRWATDETGKLYLNDHEILSAATEVIPFVSDPWTKFKDFSVTDTSFFNLGGTNTLKAVIENGGGPTGFQAQFNGSYTPVPGPLPLLGAGAALGFSRQLRRRVRQSSLRAPELHSSKG